MADLTDRTYSFRQEDWLQMCTYLGMLAHFVQLLDVNWCRRGSAAGQLLGNLVLSVLHVPAQQIWK
jgi:hypothetical protein